jgi:hypothetical protein
MPLAPVALFVFRRPAHTRRTIERLLANPEAAASEIVVFADGPRGDADVEAVEQTRAVVGSAGLPNLRLVARERNLGLARSVVAGVTELCEARGAAVVLEDDLLVAPTFLRFMNEALERYRDDARVLGVSGYTFPIEPPPGREAFFLPFPTSWGWATWARAWRKLRSAEDLHATLARDRAARRRFNVDGTYPYWPMLEALLAGRVDSWAIRWNATVSLERGLVLYPARSLVTNAGFDGTGAHCGDAATAAGSAAATAQLVTAFPAATTVDAEAFGRVKRVFRRDHGLVAKALRAARGIVRRIRPGGGRAAATGA